VSEVIAKLVESVFEPFEDAFDGVTIPVGDVLESEGEIMTDSFQPRCAIDEEDNVINIVFLDEGSQELFRNDGRSCREQLCMSRPVGCGIDGVDESGALVRQPERFAFWCRRTTRIAGY